VKELSTLYIVIETLLDPADSTDVDAITSAATALSLDDTVENQPEDLA